MHTGSHLTWLVALAIAAPTASQQQPDAPTTAAPSATVATAIDEQSADAADREWLGGAPFWRWSRLTGDWGGHRTWLEERGVEIGGGLTLDEAAAWDGGLRHRDSLVSLLDVHAAFDLERLLGWSRTIAFVDAYQIEGRDPSSDVGDVQGVSNIQADDARQVAEVWIETWIGEQLRCKVGKVDCNSEFAFTEEGGEFVNSSGAISPTIQGLPTYPNPATSINLFWTPCADCYLGAGIYDGGAIDGIRTGTLGFSGFFEDDESDAYFTVVEAGTGWVGGNSWGSGRLALGGWYHGARFTRFDGDIDRGTAGFYAVLDQRLWRENPTDAEDGQGVGLMAMVGHADDDIASITLHTQVGVTWIGALDGRDDDVVGLLISHASLSEATGSTFDGDETVFELLYKVQITPAISLKPDLQYIVNPSGDPTVDDALVGLLRLEITF